MKKGQMSVQFNWIFILIAGGILLMFFMLLIRNQMKSADYELAGDTLRSIETVVKSTEQASGTFKAIQMPDVTINVVCEEGMSYFEVGNGIKSDIPYDAIFSSETLQGNEILSWTQSWELPFEVSTFQYLTTKKTLYVIYSASETDSNAEKIYAALPSNISKARLTQSNWAEKIQTIKGYDNYRIVAFLEDHTDEFPEYDFNLVVEPKKSSILEVVTTDVNTYGTMEYADGIGGEVPFIKREMLYGAIFSENKDFYLCTVEKVKFRFGTLMSLMQSRMVELEDAATDTKCQQIYGWAQEDLANLIFTLPIRKENMKEIYDYSKSIEQNNQNLIRGRNCALIY